MPSNEGMIPLQPAKKLSIISCPPLPLKTLKFLGYLLISFCISTAAASPFIALKLENFL